MVWGMLGTGVVWEEVREEWRLVMMACTGDDQNGEPQLQSWPKEGINKGEGTV